jgi:hypothetical protein
VDKPHVRATKEKALAEAVNALTVGFEVVASGCWLWEGSFNSLGYPVVYRFYAHRIMYRIHKGAIPWGTEIDHLCRNPSCVNPEHLEAITHGENLRRGKFPNTIKTHCPRGHEYTDQNTKTVMMKNNHPGSTINPRRRCRKCLSAQRRRRYEVHGR